MGVCRDRISEGLNFSDNAARCAVIVGIPYPNTTDLKIILKKECLDNAASGKDKDVLALTGNEWYI